MKKLLSVVLTAILLVGCFSVGVCAAAPTEVVVSESTEYFEDGSSITTTITQLITDSQNQTRATRTVTGSKTKTVKDTSGSVLFKFKITGTFTVNEGVSATCTAVSCSGSDFASGWSLDSYTTSKSGNTAKATGVFKHKKLGITTVTQEVTNTLSCSTSGTLS